MKSTIFALAFFSLTLPAHAFDGTYSPADVAPTFTAAPLDLPPDLMAQANPGGTVGQGVDPLIGMWKLNAAKSTGSAWRSLTLTFTAAGGQNLVAVADGVDNQGQPTHGTLRHTYDGMPHPTDGSPDADSTIYTRLGDTINIVRFKQGKVAEVSQSVIVPNKTYTNSGEAITAASGQISHFVLVFERQ